MFLYPISSYQGVIYAHFIWCFLHWMTAPSGAQPGLSYDWGTLKRIKRSTKLYECVGTDGVCSLQVSLTFSLWCKILSAELKKESHIYHVHRVFKSPESTIPILLVLHFELEFNRNVLTKHYVLFILPGISGFVLNPWNCTFVQITALWRLCQFQLGHYLQVQKFLKQHSECNLVPD